MCADSGRIVSRPEQVVLVRMQSDVIGPCKRPKNGRPFRLVAIHRGPRIVVLPVEPVVLQEIDLLQTLARRWPARRASRKVPRVALRIQKPPLWTLSTTLPIALRIAVEVDVHSIPLRAENPHRLPVRSGHQCQRTPANLVLDRVRP